MKKGLCVLLSLLIAVSLLTACSDQTTDDSKPTAVNKTAEATTTEPSSTQITGSNEELTWDTADLSWKYQTDPVTMEMYIDFTWYGADTWGEDDISKKITEITGVTLDVTKSSDDNQLQVYLAAGELPELIFTTANVNSYFDTDVAYAWDELMEQYCPEFMELVGDVELVNNMASDGHIYTLKTHYINDEEWQEDNCVVSNGNIDAYYRSDIMEEMGNPTLTDYDDLFKLFGDVKEAYPEMVPFTLMWNIGDIFTKMMGLQNKTELYVTDDGTISYGITDSEYIDYYQWFNKLYQSGYVTDDMFSMNYSQWRQIINSGSVFMTSYNCWEIDTINEYYDENNLTGEWANLLTEIKYDDDDVYTNYDSNCTGWASFFITSNCKNPDRAILFAEFLKSPEGDHLSQWGIEGVHYTLTDNGLPITTDDYKAGGSKEGTSGAGWWYFQGSGYTEALSDVQATVSEPEYSKRVEAMKWIKDRTIRLPALTFAIPDIGSDEENIAGEVKTIFEAAEYDIITASSQTEVEELYNQMIQDMYDAGLAQLEEVLTEKYNTAQAKYDATKE